MKTKTIKLRLTKEEYKKLKKNANYVYLSPKKYLKLLASPDFCNGVEIVFGTDVKQSKFLEGFTMSNVENNKMSHFLIRDQSKFFRSIIGDAIAQKRAEEYRKGKRNVKPKDILSKERNKKNGKNKERKS